MHEPSVFEALIRRSKRKTDRQYGLSGKSNLSVRTRRVPKEKDCALQKHLLGRKSAEPFEGADGSP